MHKNDLFIMMVIVAGCLFSCNADQEKSGDKQVAAPAFDKQRAKTFLDSINLKFSEQIAAGDSVALASHYWPDAELLLDNSEPVKGKDIINAWGATIRMGVKEMTFTTTDITGNTGFIIETGHYEMKDGQKAVLDKGKYVVIWENREGQWKLYRDIGCTSLPPR